jgi:uncharacterized protein YecE (DUF72 family)
VLEDLLGLIGEGTQTVFEFRNESWFSEDVFDCLRKNSSALCAADTDDVPCTNLISTANWGYLRLRREAYTDKDLAEWIKKLRSQPWDAAFVFFKHEDAGMGPKVAARFLELAAP